MYLNFSPQDKLLTASSESSSGSSTGNWVFKNKEHGKASAAASLVLYHLVFFSCTEHVMTSSDSDSFVHA